MKNTKMPAIRFKGFNDDWEQRKLSEIALQTYGGGTPKTTNEEFWKGNIPWIQSSDLIEERLFNVKSRKYISQEAISKSATKLVPQNSVAIVTRVGVGKLVFMPFSYATSQDFLSLSELKIEPEFAVYALYKMMQLVSNEVQGTSIKGITKDELLAKEFLIPDGEEQKKIGVYLHNLDHLITLHQRKLEKIKIMKKSMLEKMFPRDAESIPKIRFDGYTDDWEQRKVCNITTSYSGGTPKSGSTEYYDGDIPFIRSGEIYSDKTELFITELGMKNSSAKMVHEGDILYALYGATSGEVSRAKLDGAINQAILAIIPNDDINANFLVEWFRKEKDKITDTYLQGGQGNLSAQIIKELEVTIPSYDEQNKIGLYFEQLNTLITLHQRKLEKLKKVKKSLLEHMFPMEK